MKSMKQHFKMTVLPLMFAGFSFACGFYARAGLDNNPRPLLPVTEKQIFVPVRSYERLTLERCETLKECEMAQAIDFFASENRPLSVPVLEPAYCDDLRGSARAQCERDNKENAGKPAHYPTICEPYIF